MDTIEPIKISEILKEKYPTIEFSHTAIEQLQKFEGMITRIDQKDLYHGRPARLSCVIHIIAQHGVVGEGEDLAELLKNYPKNPGAPSIELGFIYKYDPEFIETKEFIGTNMIDRISHKNGYDEDYIYMSNDGLVWMCDFDNNTVYHAANSIGEFITRKPIEHYTYHYIETFPYQI